MKKATTKVVTPENQARAISLIGQRKYAEMMKSENQAAHFNARLK